MANTSALFADLEGLARAFGIQGGMSGPDILRSDAGIYLYHDVADYLARNTTYHLSTFSSALDTSAGAGNYSLDVPDSAGLRYGRYLCACSVTSGSATTNVGGFAVLIRNSGVGSGFPALTNAPAILYGPGTSRSYSTAGFHLVADPSPVRLPLWCPPGTYFQLFVNTTAGGPAAMRLRLLWATTEQLDQAGSTPIGGPGAPAKV